MSHTTLVKKRGTMQHRLLENCHHGRGALDCIEVLAPRDLPERRLHFVHDDVLKPGVSIGTHTHSEDEEYYYIISGSGMMHLDGTDNLVSVVDITAVYPGGTHSLTNNGDEDLRVTVFCIC